MTLSGGFDGTDQTVAIMRKLAMGQWGARSPKVRALAINILNAAGVAPKDYENEMVAIHNYVRDQMRYTRDVQGQETLCPPEEILFNTKAGDCLDAYTQLSTPAGRVFIKDVKVGDTILGKEGKWTKVTKWWDKGVLPARRLTLANYGSFIATHDHKCFLADGSEKIAGHLRIGPDGDVLLGGTWFDGAGVPTTNSHKLMAWTEVGERPVYDIETEDHGIYLPEADVVVHNCDDLAMAEASLLASVGFSTRFKVIGVTPNSYSHVYLQAQLPGTQADVGGNGDAGWISLDPIMRQWQAGQEAPANMIAISKVYPENTTEDLNMSRTINGLHGYGRSGMGYIADQRVVSHLSPDPTEEVVPGSNTTDDHGAGNGPGNYVVMDSMLDTDLPIEAITNTAPAFPMNAHYDQMQPQLQQKRPRLYYQNGDPADQWVYDRARQDQQTQDEVEADGSNPVQGLYGLMGPAELGAIAGPMGKGGSQQPVANPNVQALVQTPEGIDKMFSRSALVMNGKSGDRILYQGMQALSERPPIRPANNVAGLGGVFGVQSRRAPMMGGLGVLGGRSMSGPGIGDLCDLADDTNAAPAPAPMTVPLAQMAPASTLFGYPTTTVMGVAAVAAIAWYFMKGKKRARA